MASKNLTMRCFFSSAANKAYLKMILLASGLPIAIVLCHYLQTRAGVVFTKQVCTIVGHFWFVV